MFAAERKKGLGMAVLSAFRNKTVGMAEDPDPCREI